MVLGSGNGTIGGMAADVRTDVGEGNTHWMTGEGWRQASTVLLYPKVRINAYNGGGVTYHILLFTFRLFSTPSTGSQMSCQVENILLEH